MKKIGVGLAFLAGASALWAEPLQLQVRESDRMTSVLFHLGYARLKNQESSSLQAFSGRLSVLQAVSAEFGILGDVEQAFSASNGFSAAYTRFAVGPSYAILGSMRRRHTEVFLGDSPVVSSDEGGARLRVNLMAEQFLLNGSSRLVGLAGFGIGLFYDFPLSARYLLSTGVRWGRVSNSSLTLTPMQFEVGVGY